jgi:hypothetical protein
MQYNTLAAQEANFSINYSIGYHTKNTLDKRQYRNISKSPIISLSTNHITKNTNLHLKFSKLEHNKIFLDYSDINYSNANYKLGIGSIDRNWSFSPNTSLILSSNSRPSPSIYLHVENENRSKYPLLSFIGPWSLELFNSNTLNSTEKKDTNLLGLRAIFKPTKKFKFELLQTTQWGGNGYQSDFLGFKYALLGNSNEGKAANINRMAGFGLSYELPKKLSSVRLYSQNIGEDESGGLPSCFMHLFGAELIKKLWEYPFIVGIETIDTRIKKTTNGNCGANTAYNNSIYKYTNHGVVMGSSIDAEGTSLAFSTKIKISKPLNVSYLIKKVVINDANWSGHRLSSRRTEGLINSLKINWNKNKFNASLELSTQNFDLNKSLINEGTSFNFTTAITF